MSNAPKAPATPQLSPAQLSTIQKTTAQAGLSINLMHLSPAADVEPTQGGFHSQQLPDGSWIIVPNKG